MRRQVGSLLRVALERTLVAVLAASVFTISSQAKSSSHPAGNPPLCVPSSVCVVNTQGNLTGTTAGLSLGGSTVTQIGNLQGSNLGSLTLTTGALLTGSLAAGGTFSNVGSSFTIKETSGGFKGILFSGTFSSPINWTVQGLGMNSKGKLVCQPKCTYTLSGNISGTWQNGMTYSGATTQLTFSSSTPFTNSIKLSQGNTFVVTAEPASLGLMGTGLLGVGIMLRRKIKSREV